MPVEAKKIFPIDRKPGTAVGVKLPFNGNAVFNSTYTTKDAIRNNLINYFLTNKNERYLNNNFGGNLRAFIFQQIAEENLDGLKENIESQIGEYFSNLKIEDLTIYQSPESNSVRVELKYNVVNTGIEDEIQLEFN